MRFKLNLPRNRFLRKLGRSHIVSRADSAISLDSDCAELMDPLPSFIDTHSPRNDAADLFHGHTRVTASSLIIVAGGAKKLQKGLTNRGSQAQILKAGSVRRIPADGTCGTQINRRMNRYGSLLLYENPHYFRSRTRTSIPFSSFIRFTSIAVSVLPKWYG